MKKALLSAMILVVGVSAKANVHLFCTPNEEAPCETRVVEALAEIGCTQDLNVVGCRPGVEGKLFCQVEVKNCNEPNPELFGFTADATKCYGAQKTSLKNVDRGLTLTWSQGLIRSYVSDVCVH